MEYQEEGMQMDPGSEKEIDDQIELFLDEFMSEEYKGIEHIVAREHYGKVFHKLLPKYIGQNVPPVVGLTKQSEAKEVVK